MTSERLFNVSCQAQLVEISQWHQHNMLGHTVVGWHLPERHTQTRCPL